MYGVHVLNINYVYIARRLECGDVLLFTVVSVMLNLPKFNVTLTYVNCYTYRWTCKLYTMRTPEMCKNLQYKYTVCYIVTHSPVIDVGLVGM